MRDSVTDLSDQANGFSDHPGGSESREHRILQAVESNALSLQGLLQQVAEVRDVIAAHLYAATPESLSAGDGNTEELDREYQRRILQLEDQVYDLEQQNSDLANISAKECSSPPAHQHTPGTQIRPPKKA